MSRFLKGTLIAVAVAGLLAGAVLWALPEIVRRVALDRVPRHTGRAVAIGDVDLNLFTGRLAVKGFRLGDRDGPEPFAEFERLDVQVSPLALLRSRVDLVDVALTAPSLRIVRTGPAEFNFSDLLTSSGEARPPAAPSRWTISLGRVRIARGRVGVADHAIAPPADWLIRDLDFDAAGLTARPGDPSGRLALRVRLNESELAVNADRFQLDPLVFRGRLTLDALALEWLNPYVFEPLGALYRQRGGRLGIVLDADVEADASEVRKGTLSGRVSFERPALGRPGDADPFVSAARLDVKVREADLRAHTLTIETVGIEALDLKVRRDVRGLIDLVEVVAPRAGPTAASAKTPSSAQPASPGAAPARQARLPLIEALTAGFAQIRVERAVLTPSTAAFVDESVTPRTTLALSNLRAQIDDFTWPVRGPAAVSVSTGLPGGGTLEAKGPVSAAPFDSDLTIAIRNAPVEPYQAYIPIPARLSGRYNGDSRNRIALRDGRLVARSRGNSWAQNVEIRESGAPRPAIRVERMDLVGIDFDWPVRAAVAKVGFRRPRVEIERDAGGSINLRRLFTPQGPEPAARPPEPAPVASGPKPKGPRETMRLDFGETRIEDGVIRFLDRTTVPAFSQDLSRLEMTLTGLGNRPDRRAKLTLQSVVGGDGALDIRGEINAIGAPAFVDLVGELRSFKLPSVDPYMAANTGWIIKKGELQYKVRFKLDGDQLSADNEVVVGQLQVAPAGGGDEVKRRIGLPLGLIVALIKDQKGDIRATVPVTGPVKDPTFSLRDAIWTAVKNVLVNVVTAPFKAIGRLFSGGGGDTVEEPKVDAVTFAAGSAVLSPAMEDHLLRVADFLRGSPFVNLTLTSAPSRADADAIRTEAVTARVRDFQKEQGLTDTDAALAAYYKARLPDVPLPPTVDEQVALLREREPPPDSLLADLGRRRVDATRERLVMVEGIPAARLTAGDTAGAPAPGPPAPGQEATGEGRVEFGVGVGVGE